MQKRQTWLCTPSAGQLKLHLLGGGAGWQATVLDASDKVGEALAGEASRCMRAVGLLVKASKSCEGETAKKSWAK